MEQHILDSKSSADYTGFSLVKGGLIYKLTSIFRRNSKQKRGLMNTALALAIITWVPLAIMALFYGTLIDDDTTISFFEDFVVHVRFLLVIPFLILIEGIVDRTFINYIKVTDNIIPNNQQERYNRLVATLVKLTNSYIPEIIVLVVYYIAIFTNPDLISSEDSGRNYLTYIGTNTLNMAGWYNFLIGVPIFLMVMFRWFWRWIVWFYSMIKISFFKVYIDPLHADKMAGLGYLNLVPLTFSFILVAPSAMLSAEIGIDIIYNNASFMSYSETILFYVFITPIILYLPLFIFMPKLTNARNDGIIEFGDLIRVHNYDYAKKWIDVKQENDEAILGTMDNSSLADINGSYGPIEEIKIIPADLMAIGRSFIMNVIPYIPLVFTYYSVAELFKLLLKSMAGG